MVRAVGVATPQELAKSSDAGEASEVHTDSKEFQKVVVLPMDVSHYGHGGWHRLHVRFLKGVRNQTENQVSKFPRIFSPKTGPRGPA